MDLDSDLGSGSRGNQGKPTWHPVTSFVPFSIRVRRSRRSPLPSSSLTSPRVGLIAWATHSTPRNVCSRGPPHATRPPTRQAILQGAFLPQGYVCTSAPIRHTPPHDAGTRGWSVACAPQTDQRPPCGPKVRVGNICDVRHQGELVFE